MIPIISAGRLDAITGSHAPPHRSVWSSTPRSIPGSSPCPSKVGARRPRSAIHAPAAAAMASIVLGNHLRFEGEPPHPRPPSPVLATRPRGCAARRSNSCPCGSIDGLRRSREPPAPRSLVPHPRPPPISRQRGRAPTAQQQLLSLRQQQTSAWGPGNHLRLEAEPPHPCPDGRDVTCSSAGLARGGDTIPVVMD